MSNSVYRVDSLKHKYQSNIIILQCIILPLFKIDALNADMI